MFDLKEKIALVTGGSVGIGRACATALAMGGANVAIAARNKEVGQKTVESVRAMGVESFFIHCDVSDEQQIQEMIASVVEQLGRLDIAINSVGFGIMSEDQTYLPKSDWDKIISLNLTSTWLCAQTEAQQMIKQNPIGGKIINIASTGGRATTTMLAPYDAAKAGVLQLTRSLATQWGRYNININCISPGVNITPASSRMSAEARQYVRNITPLGYLPRHKDWYGPVCFLASDAANYITGHELVLDGGFSIMNVFRQTSTFQGDLPDKGRSPMVTPKEEIVELKKDLDALGIPYDENGVRLVD